MKKNEIELGQKVTVTYELHRSNKGKIREWVRKQIRPCEVTVVGLRTLSNGHTSYEGEGLWIYDQDETFTGVMVVKSLHRKPFYVKLEDL